MLNTKHPTTVNQPNNLVVALHSPHVNQAAGHVLKFKMRKNIKNLDVFIQQNFVR